MHVDLLLLSIANIEETLDYQQMHNAQPLELVRIFTFTWRQLDKKYQEYKALMIII